MIDALIADLQSTDPLVRDDAAYRLGDMGPLAASAIPSLLLIAQDESQKLLLRVIAAEAISKINPSQTGVYLEVLIKSLSSGDLPTLSFAIYDLGALGKLAETALPELFRLLSDDCAGVKADAAEAIWRITGNRSPAERVGHGLLRSEDWLDRMIGEGLVEVLENKAIDLP
jgi:HEAT repeat protein